jgi:zinc protease
VPAFFTAAEQIAADLATTGPTADELARVTEPMRQLLNRCRPGTLLAQQLRGAAFDRNRLVCLPTLMRDYTAVTPEEMRALAARYLGARRLARRGPAAAGLAAAGGD